MTDGNAGKLHIGQNYLKSLYLALRQIWPLVRESKFNMATYAAYLSCYRFDGENDSYVKFTKTSSLVSSDEWDSRAGRNTIEEYPGENASVGGTEWQIVDLPNQNGLVGCDGHIALYISASGADNLWATLPQNEKRPEVILEDRK
jgi:hypothetical protein